MNFKEWLLNEMPLNHYGHQFINDDEKDPPETFYSKEPSGRFQIYSQPVGTYGDLNINDKFSRKDKAIISSPKTARVLEQKLKSSKYNFNILFIENFRINWGTKDWRPEKNLDDRISEYVKSNNLNIDQSITYISNRSAGHLMTPWMILHRLAHAIGAINGSIYDSLRIILDLKSSNLIHLANVFSFKSIQQDGRFSITSRESVEELFHELVAEYLWHGKIRLNPKVLSSDREHYQKVISDIESLIVKSLDNCVGKILRDIY
jgi:hypothetical protein